MLKYIKNEFALILWIFSLAILYPFEHIIEESKLLIGLVLIYIFWLIIYAALWVAHHAEKLAKKYWEPYWTIILTISAVTVEVIMIGVMMHNSHNPTLARDTIVSALMLDIAWLAWLASVIWWFFYWTQKYNANSSDTYTLIILVSVIAAMVIPDFISDKNILVNYNIFLVFIYLVLIYVFYKFQTITHSWFFKYKSKKELDNKKIIEKTEKIPWLYHGLWLISLIVIIWFMSEFLSVFMDTEIKHLWLPLGLWALIVAIISASPEFMTALKAAKKDQMQTVINIAFWASVATVLLTVPSMIILAYIFGLELTLWLTQMQGFMLWFLLIASILKFWDWKVTRLEWVLFLIIFAIYIFLMLNSLV